MALRLRPLTTEELEAITCLVQSRTAPVRSVERARMIWLAHQGERVPAIARSLAVTEATVRTWLSRFNAAGLDGLTDRPRPGRPPVYSTAEVGQVVATALTPPTSLGLPFACWTLDRLVTYLQETHGITIKRSRVSDLLRAEGLRWRQQETWFGERVDPAFAEKRGPSSASTRRHLRVVR
jgi:transposase